jgi:hypothetical protein
MSDQPLCPNPTRSCAWQRDKADIRETLAGIAETTSRIDRRQAVTDDMTEAMRHLPERVVRIESTVGTLSWAVYGGIGLVMAGVIGAGLALIFGGK